VAGGLFLLPRLSASAPFLALPLSIAGLFSATPLLALRLSGGLFHGVIAVLIAALVVTGGDSPETGIAFVVLFGLWALLAGEILSRRRSVVAGCAAGFLVLAVEALFAAFSEGTAPMEATLRSAQVQKAFDQWAAQAPLEPAEAKKAIEEIRTGILALYPSLSVISAATIVSLNAIALGRLVQRRQSTGFPRNELLLLRWPLALVVGFVASGALLLVPDLQTVGWNGLVVTLFLFLLQGLSVLAFSLTRLFSSPLMRTMVVVASLLGPWAIFLSLLGLFDQWFDFRSRFVSSETPAAPLS
jgi:uncharacterized protein YybS (DUF2232 family)